MRLKVTEFYSSIDKGIRCYELFKIPFGSRKWFVACIPEMLDPYINSWRFCTIESVHWDYYELWIDVKGSRISMITYYNMKGNVHMR